MSMVVAVVNASSASKRAGGTGNECFVESTRTVTWAMRAMLPGRSREMRPAFRVFGLQAGRGPTQARCLHGWTLAGRRGQRRCNGTVVELGKERALCILVCSQREEVAWVVGWR